MTFYSEQTRTARKAHVCQSCSKRIEPGETYLRGAGVWEGDFWSAAFHPDCRAWEVKLCHEGDLLSDEWMSLAEWVAEDRRSLDGAPESVRARFPETVR